MIQNIQDSQNTSKRNPASDIERSLEYLSIGRKLLSMESSLRNDDGKVIYYPDKERNFLCFQFLSPSRMVLSEPLDDNTLPVFSATHKYKNDDHPEYVNERNKIKVMECIQEFETKNIVEALIAVALRRNKSIVATHVAKDSLREAFLLLEKENNTVLKVVMHPGQFSRLLLKDFHDFYHASTRERLTANLFGHLWTADIHVTTSIPEKTILLTGCRSMTGFFAHHMKVTDGPTVAVEYEFAAGIYDDMSAVLEIL